MDMGGGGVLKVRYTFAQSTTQHHNIGLRHSVSGDMHKDMVCCLVVPYGSILRPIVPVIMPNLAEMQYPSGARLAKRQPLWVKHHLPSVSH